MDHLIRARTFSFAAVSLAITISGCGGASFVLKSPVADRCRDAGLRGCDDLVDGVVGYVDGSDKESAKTKIRKGAAENEPEPVAKFAGQLKAVGKLPGLDSYSPTLVEIASLLEGAGSTPGGHAPGAVAGSTSTTNASSAASNDDARTKTTTAIVAGHARAYACTPLGKSTQSLAGATCLRLGIGPLVVTDVVSSSSCPGEVVVLSGAADAPSWAVSAAPRERMGIHGARLVVAPEDELIVAVHTNGPPTRDLSCAVTLSTRRP
jgi:hypothetical protein